MSKTLIRIAVCFSASIGVAATAGAQPEVRKQKENTEAALKQVGIAKPAAVETDGLLMYGSVPADQAKTLAATVQKVYQTSRSNLGYAGDDALWPGKLTVVVLSDPKQFADYYKKVAGQTPADGQTSAFSIQGNTPYLILGPAAGAKPGEFDPTKAAANLMATAILNRRAGTGTGNGTLPDWLTGGFAQGILARTDDDPNALKTHRNSLRLAVLGDPTKPPGRTPVLADAWSGPRTPANNTMSAAFVEYLQQRTTPAQFNRFLAAFRQEEGKPPPTLAAALKTLPMSRVSMETDWKIWAGQQR